MECRKAARPHNASIELTPPAGGTHSLPHLALPVYAILNGSREVLTVYWWADGIHTGARSEDSDGQCLLVIIGVKPDGTKERVAITDGYRESKASWSELLLDLKARGLQAGPMMAIGDGAMGLWTALEEVFPQTRHQRCWFHKIGNVLNALPKSQHGKAKAGLGEIWNAATRADAMVAFHQFVAGHEAKYPKAAEMLKKDRDELLAFYDFPAEHWQHLRTTNPIESTFATVRHLSLIHI